MLYLLSLGCHQNFLTIMVLTKQTSENWDFWLFEFF